jgi:MtaA/CmuA family methyltransferase
MTGRERVLNKLAGIPTDRVPLMPITMMFAADLHGVSYKEYATNYKALVDAQIKVAETFGFDYVSCISDPAREAADCGAAVEFYDNQPPAIHESKALLADKGRLTTLAMPDPFAGGRMLDRIQAAALFKEKVGNDKLIEGWIEGPCAEGADLRGINTLMMDFIEDTAFVEDLFAFVLEMELAFAKAQIEAGADIIGLGDAAASLVGPMIYEQFVWPVEKKLVDGIHELGGRVRLHICGNTTAILDGMGRLGCEMVDLDWMVPMDKAREVMGEKQVLSGNMDPIAVLRNGTAQDVMDKVAACHRQAGDAYIIAAGCEITRDTPHENVHALLGYALSNEGG